MVPKTSIHRKLELARQELLDLGLRNPLLNYRTLKARGLDIVQEKPEDLYRLMVEEKRKLTFLAASEVKPANVESDEITADALAMEFVETEHLGQQDQQYTAALDLQQREGYTSGTRLQTNYSDKQLETRLLGTYHAARTHIEEQGVNVLYLALGMLHWHETEISAEERKAPLVLIPVQLARVSARERFTIAYTDDELGHNLSLAAKLKTDFAIELPELPEEEGLDVQAYFSAVKQAVSGQQRWKVDIEAISVGFFSFGKFLMYRDLDAANWPENSSPEGHPIISALLEDGFREQPSLIGDDEPIDRYFKLMEAHHIMDADSSQIMAILDANQGRNMVIQGPPGTGKSQTITNLIAEAIGAGKKVLFVSEKMAALEVVKRRLDAAGLGVACLELHSHKTNKKTLLSELAATLDLGKPNYQEDGNLTLLEDLRTRLNDYSNAINTPVGQSRVTPYQALGRLAEYQLANKDITLPKVLMPNMETWTAEQFTKRQALVEELQKLMESMGLPALHPFWGSGIKVVLPFEIETLRQQVLAADENLQALLDSCREYTLKLGNPPVKDAAELSVYIQLLDRTVQAPDLKGVLADSDKWVREAGTLDKLGEAGLAYSRIHEQYDAHLLPEAWEHDWIEERQALVTYQGKWWRFLSGTYRKARNKVLGLCRNLKDTGSLLPLLDAVIDARHHEVFIGAHETLVRDLFREDWKGAFSNWEKIAATSKWMTALHQEIIAGSLPHWMLELLRSSQSPDGLALERLRVASAGLSRSLTEVRRQIDSLEEALEFNMSKRMEDSSKLIQLDFFMLAELLNLWKDRTSSLQQLASYNNLAQLCRVEELDPFLRLMEQYTGEDPPHLVDCFRWNWYQALASRAFLERDVLPQFEGNRHEHAIVKFREL
ncbi:DUF4011 domain-containing protein, partial [Paenibacillus sepulcri]|nr:DUF4011 domain-containing protein [Paenibacillus sepulcri]